MPWCARKWGTLQESTDAAQTSLKGFCDFQFCPCHLPAGTSHLCVRTVPPAVPPPCPDCHCRSQRFYPCPGHCSAVAPAHRTLARPTLCGHLRIINSVTLLQIFQQIKCKQVKSFHWNWWQWSIKALQNTQYSRAEPMPELRHGFSQPNLPSIFRECFALQNSHGFGSPLLPSLPGSSLARFQTVSGWWLHLFLSAWCNIPIMA